MASGRIAIHVEDLVVGFSDHVVVSARSVVRIDPEVPWDIAALFGCAVLTGVGAVVNAAQVRPGDELFPSQHLPTLAQKARERFREAL